MLCVRSAAGVLVLMTVLAAGCRPVFGHRDGITITGTAKVWVEESKHEVIPVGASPTVIVDDFCGTVDVKAGAAGSVVSDITRKAGGDDDATAQATLAQVVVTTTHEGDTVRIVVKREPPAGAAHDNFPSSAKIRLTVPAASVVELASGCGAVTAGGVAGRVAARSANGSVEVADAGGAVDARSECGSVEVSGGTTVRARSSNGSVTVKGASGAVDAHSDCGGVDVAAKHAAVSATSSNGSVEVTGAAGAVVAKSDCGSVSVAGTAVVLSARSSNGSVTFAGDLAVGSHTMHSDCGSVECTLPKAAAFDLDASTACGSVDNGFALATTRHRERDHVTGTVGAAAGTTLTLRSGNGSIEIKPGG